MEVVAYNIKSLEIIPFFTNPIFFRSCYQPSFPVLSENLFVSSTFLTNYSFFQIPAFPNSSFLRQLLFQAAANSGFFKFWLPQATSCFRLRKILASSISEKFQLLQIPASKNSSFTKFWLPQASYSKIGCEKFWLRRILSLITVSSL